MKNLTKWAALAMVAGVALLLVKCNKDDAKPSSDDTFNYFGTASPGDAWTISGNMRARTFDMKWDHGTSGDETDDVTISGTFSLLWDGGYKLIIDNVAPAVLDIPFDGTAIIYGIEVPGVAFLAKPAGSISQYHMITMTQRHAGELAKQNGTSTFNFLRIAFPLSGFGDLTTSPCWGVVQTKVDASTNGGYNLGQSAYSLGCAEHDMNSNLGDCTGENTETYAGDPTLIIDKVYDDGSLKQVAGFDPGQVKRFTGQLAGDIFIADNGEGGGGQLGIRKNDAFALADINDNSFVFNGLSSWYDRTQSPSPVYELYLRMQFVSADSAIIKVATSFETSVLNLSDMPGEPAAAFKIKTLDSGIMKGYYYDLHNDTRSVFVALAYAQPGKKFFSLITSPKSGDIANQAVMHFGAL